jgi:hypothetical protein
MKEVIVFVEGPSDKLAMQALLQPLLDQKRNEGITINFYALGSKTAVIKKAPLKGVNTILNKPFSLVVALPDLYPRDEVFPHKTANDLIEGILKRFEDAFESKGKKEDGRLKQRFRAFCFKYDLEALILASDEALKARQGARSFKLQWRVPVEDQDHDYPPKRVVVKLFAEHGESYIGPVDAPFILGATRYQEVADKCPQCFKPFVEFLNGLSAEGA